MEGDQAFLTITFDPKSDDADKVYRLIVTSAEAKDMIPADAVATKKRGRKAANGDGAAATAAAAKK